MATAQERLKIWENIMGEVGVDGDVLGRFAKAMSTLNGLQTMTEMTQPSIGTSTPQTPTDGTQVPPMVNSGLNGSVMP
jgi:hypothetical protein